MSRRALLPSRRLFLLKCLFCIERLYFICYYKDVISLKESFYEEIFSIAFCASFRAKAILRAASVFPLLRFRKKVPRRATPPTSLRSSFAFGETMKEKSASLLLQVKRCFPTSRTTMQERPKNANLVKRAACFALAKALASHFSHLMRNG